ncbi:MAG: 2-oxoglutarate dehydrogenase complex dihydrolipoyllysine-residue succinyltransferase [Bacteroidetes bacterium]|nr:2-oxoglutarate dehydrogenase complex dihydrolipoyllysine-residue succinyltransferase [Bacteroidota bacterium]
MTIEIKVPSPGESISEVQLASWLVKDGDYVEKDQEIAEIDSDKATLTISAEESGIIKLMIEEGNSITVGSVIATINVKKTGKDDKPPKTPTVEVPAASSSSGVIPEVKEHKKESGEVSKPETTGDESEISLSPLARKILAEKQIQTSEVVKFFRSLRLSKKDVEFFLEHKDKVSGTAKEKPADEIPSKTIWGNRETERKKMSTLRLKIAERLVSVKNETAMLTTFNEVNMTPIIKIRNRYKDIFKEKYGVSLGFMSFFTKAVTEALHQYPSVNAMIDGQEIVYHHYADIGIAVSTPKGLMVPVIRNAETMSLAEIESGIKEMAIKARDNKITLEEMQGGTFTITNGGVFGSMLSTPIINPPQSAILGMHNIVERPVAIEGKVEIHPIMYVALSYDHRIIDGRESVGFLVKVKEMLEDPAKMLFGGNDPVQSLLGL